MPKLKKELLAVQFGLQHFHHYVGQAVQVETDYKPLIGLVDKPVGQCTPRIQRMRMQLQSYDFRLHYTPGKKMHLADALSRSPESREYVDDSSQHNDEQVNAILNYVIPDQTAKEKYAVATQADPILQMVMGLVEKACPKQKRDCPVLAKPYWSVGGDLSSSIGLLLKGEQIVVPDSLRPEILKKVHDGHFGESKSIERAKSAVYWPGYTDQIRNPVAGCAICQERRNQNPAQQFYPVEIPDYPFQKVGADLFELQKRNYLLVVDYYSKWPCVVPLKSLTSSATVEELDRIFADFGLPEVVISDNGPQFGCAEFRAFAKKMDFVSSTSSPEYPEGNGMAERTVQTVKNAFIKSMEDGKSLQDSLRAIRSTPVGDGLPSPSVLLQARNLRGSLPFLSSALQHRQIQPDRVRECLQQRQAGAAFHQSRACQNPVPTLNIDQRVRVRIGKRWIPGSVTQVCQQPNSYVVHTDDGRDFRRNRRAINIDRSRNSPDQRSQSLSPRRPVQLNTASFVFPTLNFPLSGNSGGGGAIQPVLHGAPNLPPAAPTAPESVQPPDPGETDRTPSSSTGLANSGGAVPPLGENRPASSSSSSGVARPPGPGEIDPALPSQFVLPTSSVRPTARKQRREWPPPQRSSKRVRCRSEVLGRESSDKPSSGILKNGTRFKK